MDTIKDEVSEKFKGIKKKKKLVGINNRVIFFLSFL